MAIGWTKQGGVGPEGGGHPLATEPGIRDFLNSTSASQPSTKLDQVCDALESAFDAGLEHKVLRRALRLLDGGVQKTLADMQLAMLRESKGGQISELPAAAIAKYCRRLCALSERALDAPEGETMTVGASSDGLIVVRAMRAWALRKKVLRMSYRFPDEELWAVGNRLVQFAQMRGLLDKELEPYPGEGGPSTVLRERLAGLLFDMAPCASLAPPQMQALDALLRLYADNFIERGAPAAELPFYVDLMRAQPPQRWLPGLPLRASLRFFGLGAAGAKIALLAKDAKGAAPPPWAAASGCSPEAAHLLVGMLARHWSDKPPQRRERRTAGDANVLIVNGFEDTRRAVAASEEALKIQRGGAPELKGELMRDDKYFDRIRFGSVNPDKTTTGKLLRRQLVLPQQVLEKQERGEGRPAPENSAVADTSESGLGVALPGRAPWARVGVIVGLRAPDSLQWEVAVVRRLVRGARLSLGLERIRGSAVTARLMHVQGSAATGIGAREAMLFAEPLNQLITPDGACAEGDTFTVLTEAGQFTCRIARVLELGPDFVRAQFEKTSESKPAAPPPDSKGAGDWVVND